MFLLLLQFCRLCHQRLHSTRGSSFNLETSDFRRPRDSLHHRPRHIVLVSNWWGEEARQPQTATGTEVRLWTETFYFLVFVKAKLQLRTLYSLSQGQRGRFRLRLKLDRTGQHGLAHVTDPQTNRAIDWYFALGGTNGRVPVGSYRHCLVQSHCCCSTSTKLDYKIFSAWNLLSSFLQSDVKSLTFWITYYIWYNRQHLRTVHKLFF